MKQILNFWFWLILLQFVNIYATTQEHLTNISNWQEHRERHKRFLIYQNGGIIKLVVGVSLPAAEFRDKIFWRQLTQLINLQVQFPLPQKPIYWWNKFNAARQFTSHDDDEIQPINVDYAQQYIYKVYVDYMLRQNVPGEACLARLICSNAQIDVHNGLYAQLLQRILIPHHSLDALYVDAYKMGQYGIDCRQAFPKADLYDCILERYMHVTEEHAL